MNRALLGYWVFLATLFASAGYADDTFTVTRSTVVSFGRQGGDTFGVDRISQDTAFVLIRPRGESCTLRFPLGVGERLFLRTVDGDGQPVVCEASLVALVDDTAARFSARCRRQITSTDRKCPP
jgi:hypothetical protein